MTNPRLAIPQDLIGEFSRRLLDLTDESRRIIHFALLNGFRTSAKPDQSLVTNVDLEVEERLRSMIQEFFPAHGIVGEEFPALRPDADFQWIMDPIDGTEEFVHGIPTFGTIIGLYYRGEPVAGALDFPALDLRVHAARGLGCHHNDQRVRVADSPDARDRISLSARANFVRYRDDGAVFEAVTRAFPNHRVYRTCLGHALAAVGAVDVMVDWHNKIWDLAAAQILVEEAGGRYTTVREIDLPGSGRIYSAVFGKPATVERLVTLIA
jgi:fructose-1,6-bisphosphatase/inositol monophosphatase family enzyme